MNYYAKYGKFRNTKHPWKIMFMKSYEQWEEMHIIII